MTLARTAPARRRPPPPLDRYRAAARAAKARRARPRLPALLTGLVWGLVLASAVSVAGLAAGGIVRTAGSVGAAVGSAIAVPAATAELTVAETTGQVAAAPLLDALPQFTKEAALVVQGRIPSFGQAADRKVRVLLNGAAPQTVPYDANGHFAASVLLANGVNQVVVELVGPGGTVAATSTTVVLDTVPPPLALSRPVAGATVDGPNLTVEGKAEPGATVLVNDRVVIVGPDGSFSDTQTVAPGPVTLSVVARDRAGNETKTQLAVTVRPAASPGAGATVAVSLSSTTVKPGAVVTATIVLSSAGAPLAGQTVSLQVGVILIGTAVTDAAGRAQISFAAPPSEGTAQVVVLAGAASGSALLTVAK